MLPPSTLHTCMLHLAIRTLDKYVCPIAFTNSIACTIVVVSPDHRHPRAKAYVVPLTRVPS
jgi:hypothetical protein